MAGNELTVQTSLPSLGKLQRSMANEQSMLGKAASLVPDTQTFLETILDRDIHSADSNAAANAMQQIAGDYLSNYSKDPFYAFTKRGKTQASRMQSIVNNPMFKQMEHAKKLNDSEFTRVRDEGLTNELVLDDYGRLATRNIETGERSFKYASDIDPTKEIAVDVNTDHVYLDRVDGGKRIASYDVQSVEDTENQIRNAISKLGTAKWKNETDEIRNSFAGQETGEYGVTNVREREDNINRINSEIQRLQSSGLSPKAMKSLYSTYYRNNPNEYGKEGAEDRAKRWAFDQIRTVATGGRITKDFRSTKKGIAGDNGAGGSSAPLQVAQAWKMGAYGKVDSSTLAGQYYTSRTGKKLLNDVAFSGEMTKDEHGRPIQMTRVEDTPIAGVFNLDRAMYAVAADNEDAKLKAGELKSLPKSVFESGAFVYDPDASFTMYTGYVDKSGNVFSSKKAEEIRSKLQSGIGLTEAEAAKYLTPDGRIRTGRVVESQFLIPDEYGAKTIGNQNLVEELKTAGYTSNEENARELKVRGGLNLDTENKLFSYDDNAMRVSIVMPANDEFFTTGAGFAFKDTPLMDKRHAFVQNQRTRQTGQAVATDQNAVQTGNTGLSQGYYNLDSTKK